MPKFGKINWCKHFYKSGQSNAVASLDFAMSFFYFIATCRHLCYTFVQYRCVQNKNNVKVYQLEYLAVYGRASMGEYWLLDYYRFAFRVLAGFRELLTHHHHYHLFAQSTSNSHIQQCNIVEQDSKVQERTLTAARKRSMIWQQCTLQSVNITNKKTRKVYFGNTRSKNR